MGINPALCKKKTVTSKHHSINILGQGTPSHSFVSRPIPVQFFPPNCGLGELHRRIRVMLPIPQVTEQADHGDQ